MKKLIDLPLFDVLMKVSTEDRGTVLTVEQGLRHLMFMQAVSEEIEVHPTHNIDLNKIGDLAREHSGQDTLDINQMALYCRLAALTYRLIL